MPKTLKQGDRIRNYTIEKMLNKGAMASAYAARGPRGEKVFLKQYFSPSTAVSWYKNFVIYQHTLRDTIQRHSTKEYCVRPIDIFEEKFGCVTLFSAFEFIEHGNDLGVTLEGIKKGTTACPWQTRLTYAKVFMAGLKNLHAAGIVHGDLKPPNIHLIKDSTIKIGYSLKLIDMDFAILTAQRAPWHGAIGYIGSPRYFSPEHLTPNGVPSPHSDVFTSALILCELLGKGHPFPIDDPGEYRTAIMRRAHVPIELVTPLNSPDDTRRFTDLIRRALSPEATERPSSTALHAGLLGKFDSHAPSPAPLPSPAPAHTLIPTRSADWDTSVIPEVIIPLRAKDDASKPSSIMSDGDARWIELSTPSATVRFSIAQVLSREGCKQFGDEWRYLDSPQCRLQPDAGGHWWVHPEPKAVNQTLVNGKAVLLPQVLADGDVLAVGNEAKGVVKCALRVSLARVRV